MPTPRLVSTATLLRGGVYSIRHPINKTECLRFEYKKPVIVTDDVVLGLLESLHDEIEDRDGEVYEKPLFRIDRKVPAQDDDVVKAAPSVRKSTGIMRRPPSNKSMRQR